MGQKVRLAGFLILILILVNLNSIVIADPDEDHYAYLPYINSPEPTYPRWAAKVGGSSNDTGSDIVEFSDGNFAVAGYNGSGGFPGYIFTIDDHGDVGWQKSHQMGGSLTWIDSTTDGNIIVAGPSIHYDGTAIVKHKPNGSVLWRQFIDGDDSFSDASLTNDDGLVLAGGLYASWVLSLDNQGSLVWEKGFQGDNVTLQSIEQDDNEGFIVAGQTTADTGAGSWDGLVLNLDDSGQIAWQKTFGSTDAEYIESIHRTSDGGFITAGWIWTDTSQDGWVMKVDHDQNVEWSRAYAGDDLDNLLFVSEISDNGYIVSGWSQSFGTGAMQGWVIRLSEAGAIIWQRTYSYGIISAIRDMEDGGFIAVGGNAGDAWVLRLDDYGNIPQCTIIEESNAQERDHSVIVNDVSVTSGDITSDTGGNFYVAEVTHPRTFVCPSGLEPYDPQRRWSPDYERRYSGCVR